MTTNYRKRILKRKLTDREKLEREYRKQNKPCGHEYLEKLMLPEGLPWQWQPNDERQADWKQERLRYGFDEREMWNGYASLIMLVYERLMWWKEHMSDGIKNDHFEIKIKGRKKTFNQALDYCIEGLKLHLTLDDFAPERKDKKHEHILINAMPLALELFPYIGW